MTDRRDDTILELQSIFARRGTWLSRKLLTMKRPIQPIAAPITREHATRTVGSMRARSQAHNQEAGRRRAEVSDRPSPIIPILIRSTLHSTDLLAMRNQTGTTTTGLDLCVQSFPAFCHNDRFLGAANRIISNLAVLSSRHNATTAREDHR